MFFLYKLILYYIILLDLYILNVFYIYLYCILFHLHVDNKLVTKKCFCFCACRKSNKKFNLVTVQYQIVKSIIQWKKTRIFQVKYKSTKYNK